jgi:hypothetical protein
MAASKTASFLAAKFLPGVVILFEGWGFRLSFSGFQGMKSKKILSIESGAGGLNVCAPITNIPAIAVNNY